MRKISYLDSCKGIAILGVFLVHSTMLFSLFNITSLPLSIEELLNTGRLGVATFFIISGYTVFRSLMNKTVGKNFYIKYVIKKFLRLAPPFYCALLVAYILSLTVMQEELNITSSNMLMHFTFLYGLGRHIFNNILGVEWFLFNTLIFSFIILIPYKLKKYLTYKNTFVLFVITLIISSLFSLKTHAMYVSGSIDTATYSWLYFSPINWLFTFFSGIFMFYFFKDKNASKIKLINKHSKISAICVISSIILISYLNLPFENILVSLLLIILIFTLHSIWFINRKFSSFFKLFDNKVFSTLGKISYSFYLVHYLVLIYLKKYVNPDIFTNTPWFNYFLLALISFALSLAVASILYFFVERKPILLKNIHLYSSKVTHY